MRHFLWSSFARTLFLLCSSLSRLNTFLRPSLATLVHQENHFCGFFGSLLDLIIGHTFNWFEQKKSCFETNCRITLQTPDQHLEETPINWGETVRHHHHHHLLTWIVGGGCHEQNAEAGFVVDRGTGHVLPANIDALLKEQNSWPRVQNEFRGREHVARDQFKGNVFGWAILRPHERPR